MNLLRLRFGLFWNKDKMVDALIVLLAAVFLGLLALGWGRYAISEAVAHSMTETNHYKAEADNYEKIIIACLGQGGVKINGRVTPCQM